MLDTRVLSSVKEMFLLETNLNCVSYPSELESGTHQNGWNAAIPNNVTVIRTADFEFSALLPYYSTQ